MEPISSKFTRTPCGRDRRVLLCDDLLATGGTAAAAIQARAASSAARLSGAAFAVELNFLNGRAKLPGIDVFSLLKYDK